MSADSRFKPPVAEVGSDAYKAMMSGIGKPPAPPKTSGLAKFQAFDTSGIALEVKAGANAFSIDLAKLVN